MSRPTQKEIDKSKGRVPTALSMIIAGIVAIASLTMNTTMDLNGILMSVTTT